jgi:zinc protease
MKLGATGRGVRLAFAACLAGASLGAASSAQSAPGKAAVKVASASAEAAWAPETFQLSSGMQVVVLPDHRAPVVTHMIWYKVGSADEVKGKSGLAHFLEHLMFKATDKIPAGEYSKIVARNGGQDNAETTLDYTAYYFRIAKDRLPQMMQMEADRMVNLKLGEDEVKSELKVVQEERRQNVDSSPGSLLYEKISAALYAGHPYAVPVIGHMDEVAKLTRQDAVDWYNTWYGPENAILVVAGDMTAAELKPLAEAAYGGIKPKGNLHTRTRPEVKPLTRSVEVSHADPEVRQPDWSRHWLGVAEGDPQEEALEVGLQVLGGGRTSRLNRELVEKQMIAVAAYAGSDESFARGSIIVGASPAPGHKLDEMKPAVEAVVAKFLDEGPTPQELERAKSNIAASATFARDSQVAMANWYGGQLVIGQSVDRVLHWEDRIRAVTAEQVKTAMNAYMKAPHVDARLIQGGK